jgi:NADH-quinone oxidoreductase subunit L
MTMMLVVALIGRYRDLRCHHRHHPDDIKKVLAFDCLTLGFMFCTGVGAFAIGIFHVMTRVCKALMFLGSGSVIHGMHHSGHAQDGRRRNGVTYMTFMAGWLAICGIIPFSTWSGQFLECGIDDPNSAGLAGVVDRNHRCDMPAFPAERLMAMTFWVKKIPPARLARA